MNDSKKIVTDVFTSLSNGNVAQAEMNLSDDFRTTVMNKPVDKKGYINAISTLKQGIPDLQINLHDIEEKGDKVHAFVNLRGTHSKEIPSAIPGFKALTPSGKQLKAHDVEVEISLKDHKIQEIKSVQSGNEIFNDLYAQLSN